MSKRLTDTNKYKKAFIRSLPGAYKLLWDYLYHDCDHAGIWHKDFSVAQIYLGFDMPVNEDEALRLFNNDEERIVVLNHGSKWFIKSFIDFQYGELNPNNRVHASVISELTKNGVVIKPLTSPLQGAMDKDMDKEKDMDMEKDTTASCQEVAKDPMTVPVPYQQGNENTLITPLQFNQYLDKARGYKIPDYGIKMMMDHYADWISQKRAEHPASKDYKGRSAYHNLIGWVMKSWWFDEGSKLPVPDACKHKTFSKFESKDFEEDG